ncbi:MAG: threonylcarbamoyl-AMP synthase [Magnetococcales bacterium]|nr:threonylcarbamoyl-AMP synthase [Magnetococcales bacterium]
MPPETLLIRAMAVLSRGGVIAHPTETLFGLAADPRSATALQRLERIKGVGSRQGYILLVPGREGLAGLIDPPGETASQLMDHFWPGPLTLVLPGGRHLPQAVTGGSGFVALRHSPSETVRALMRHWQAPLLSTSANRHGRAPLADAAEVQAELGREVELILPGKQTPGARPSTLLKVVDNQAWLLRNGALSATVIAKALPRLDLRDASGTPLR